MSTIVQIIEKKEQYLACPECDEIDTHRITGIKAGTTFGPLFCKSCGVGIVGHITKNGEAEIRTIDERRIPTYVLLRLVRQEKPVFLVVRDVTCERPGQGDETENEAFYESNEFIYNHQLSTSVYIGNSVVFMREGDVDSYGMFEYVSSAPAPRNNESEETEEEVVLRLFQRQLGLNTNREEKAEIIDFPTTESIN